MSDIEKDGCARDETWDHMTPAEAYGEGWSDGHAVAKDAAADRITELEAPFILTDQVPTVPGWYLVKWPTVGLRMMEITEDMIDKDAWNRLAAKHVKRGSAPLPQPQEKYDE